MPPIFFVSTALIKFNLMTNNKDFDVMVIGGSYAGLSAAMALGRSLRNVLIIDSGSPCNQQTPHSHNFITHDGEKPAIITEKAKAQVLKYPTIQFLEDFAVSAEKNETGFTVSTPSGKKLHAKKIIFATGIKDLMPGIKGFAECWGITAVHCPYCHGYELRHKKTGLLANGEKAFHLASLINNLTSDLTILTSGKADFNPEQVTKLTKHKIKIIDAEISAIEHENGYMKNVMLKDGNKIPFDGVYAPLPFVQHSEIPAALGCEMTEMGHIKTDAFQKTTVEGIYACGDNSNMMRSVAQAVYSGNMAGAMVNKELVDEQF